MGSSLEQFKTMMTVQIFWSLVFTLLVYTLPGSDSGQLALITMSNGTTDLATISDSFESAVTNQTNIPIVEMGALLFYSGNIIIDLLLNFAFAIPEMFSILLNILFLVLPVAGNIQHVVTLFFMALISIGYAIGILQFVTNIRSGGSIA
ncbi:MAG TPA: hypothetical protein PKN54_02360 [Candidatus Cloacimonas acidaminovorans]|nr:hypothetical protein [Candidatus Cloacimonas acidaminovorans]